MNEKVSELLLPFLDEMSKHANWCRKNVSEVANCTCPAEAAAYEAAQIREHFAARPSGEPTKSVQKRIAAQKGEPYPFAGEPTGSLEQQLGADLEAHFSPREPTGEPGIFGRTDLPNVMVYTAKIADGMDRPTAALSGWHQMVMFGDHQRALDKALAAREPTRGGIAMSKEQQLQQVGRIALRHEGEWWVAYYAATDTMQGAQELARIGMWVVAENEAVKQQFVALTRAIIEQLARNTSLGDKVEWKDPVAAPEHEKARHS